MIAGQVAEMKSARDSGELQADALKDEIDQLRVWKDKVLFPVIPLSLKFLLFTGIFQR